MADDRKYVRVYYNDLIRDYPSVWADDAQLATWLRMLATADPMWPTPPELPRSVRSRPLAALVDATLVETLPDHRFRLKGLDAERERRAASARNAAAVRWHSEGIPTPDATAMPKRVREGDEQRRDDPAAPAATDERDCLDTYYELTLYRPWGSWSGDKLREAQSDYGDDNVSFALRAEAQADPDRKTLLDRSLARLARTAERARLSRPRKPRNVRVVSDEERAAALEEIRRETA